MFYHDLTLKAQEDGRLRQAQLKMLAILEQVDTICTKHKLEYWLDGGTLLGAIRHQGFIPWDDDLDIAMPRASYERFLLIAATELPPHLKLQTHKTDPGYFNLSVPLKIRDSNSRFIEWHEQGNEPYLKGIFIDVFTIDTLPTSRIKRCYYKVVAKKIVRLLRPKYSKSTIRHCGGLYQFLSALFPKKILESLLQFIIRRANQAPKNYLGCGYDSVNSSRLSYADIYPLRRGRFESGQFNIPNHPEALLTQLYGDYMTLPPKSQQVMKHCKELIPELFDPSV